MKKEIFNRAEGIAFKTIIFGLAAFAGVNEIGWNSPHQERPHQELKTSGSDSTIHHADKSITPSRRLIDQIRNSDSPKSEVPSNTPAKR